MRRGSSLLDDAFPKIDTRTHPLLFGLLVDLDLDFVTSERLWGTHATVPELAIYEALRSPMERGIAQYQHRWDGQRLERGRQPDRCDQGHLRMSSHSPVRTHRPGGPDDRLTRVWGLISDRLERGGLQPEGQVRIEKLSRAERHAVSDLLAGRPVTASQVVIGLSDRTSGCCGPGRHWSRRPSRSPSAASWTAARSEPSGGPDGPLHRHGRRVAGRA